MKPDVAVVIANYAGDDVLDACLLSVRAQTHLPAELTVVDAGPSRLGPRIAESHGAVVLRRPNRGLGYLYNEGTRAARSELVLLLNNDVALDRHCLELLVHELASSPRHFAADPRQLSWNGMDLVHGRASLRRGPLARQPLPGFRLELRGAADTSVPTLSANGGAMLVRRDRLLELGGFDETMFMDFEDLDLCWRAWSRGWSSVYVPEATLRHHVGTATRESGVLASRIRSSHHNLLRFALKCLPLEAVARVVLGELLRLPRHPSLIAPALARIALELPEILRERRRIEPSRRLLRWMLAGQPVESQGMQP
ncbi:MAG: glycosyltransferase family 2 protein [Actinobacteria bacterium]|nr:glycosyltransferase family 2 protein [Actinomycetota bacterium]